MDPFNNYTEYSKKWNKLLLNLVLSSIESDTKSDKQIASIKFRRKNIKDNMNLEEFHLEKKFQEQKMVIEFLNHLIKNKM